MWSLTTSTATPAGEAAKPGLGGVNIALEDGPTATTSLDGKYRFANVAEGSYMLYLDSPAGVSVGRTNRTVNVAAGGSALNFASSAKRVAGRGLR